MKVVELAADRQMAHVRSFAGGPRAAIAQRVLNEPSCARTMLQTNLGQVYKACHKSDGLIVALHVAPAELAQSEEYRKRLKREFEITQSVQHPHIIASYEMGEIVGRPFLALEYVGGADLAKVGLCLSG